MMLSRLNSGIAACAAASRPYHLFSFSFYFLTLLFALKYIFVKRELFDTNALIFDFKIA